MASLPPPTYEPVPSQRTQLLISPSPDAVQFQKGFLGAQGERAAIEGELQIKGAEDNEWDTAQAKYFLLRVYAIISYLLILFRTISLETIESTPQQSIEISSSALVLFSRPSFSSSSSPSSSNIMPSTLPFSIPLTPDTPQCIHTTHSSITHRLVATLHPSDRTAQPLTKVISVHTRRYTSPNRPLLQTMPQNLRSEDPVSIKVEVPRTTFRIGEPIPVYITVPPPEASAVMERGLRLRNVMAELVRVVALGGNPSVTQPETSTAAGASAALGTSFSLRADEKSDPTLPSRDTPSNIPTAEGLHTILTRSGSSCRFHTSRPVQIRLLLYPHQSALHTTDEDSSLHNTDQIENDNTDCTSITQSTILHTVSFHVALNTTFLNMTTHSESITTMNIPIVLLPNPAPLPEVDESVASAYRKKHDRPPMRTVRHEDADVLANEAGPSAPTPGAAPPPFEERDAPPPFFASESQASTSSRLPTFLESESDAAGHIPMFSSEDRPGGSQPLGPGPYISIPGEGTEFGFIPSDQYDGISGSLDRTSTPPPTMANATLDTDVTDFANLQPGQALEALSLALEQPDSEGDSAPSSGHSLPPPPPLLDDPSDPPPSIDVEEFRRPPAPSMSREGSPPPSSLPPTNPQDLSAAPMPQGTPLANAPPPYLHPQGNSEPEETVTRPPPYVDVLPAGDAAR